MPPEPLTSGLLPPHPRSLCPLSSTEFVEPPRPEQNSWVRHCMKYLCAVFMCMSCHVVRTVKSDYFPEHH